MHIQDTEQRRWLQECLEDPANAEPPDRELQLHILERLNAAEAFERFLHTSYVGQKRFSLEGAETLIPMLDLLLRDAADAGIEQCVMGMAHRGRLNVLSQVVGKSYGQIFREFEGMNPESAMGSGDVKYHLGALGEFSRRSTRWSRGWPGARQDRLRRQASAASKVLPVLIHGDAAFAGQGCRRRDPEPVAASRATGPAARCTSSSTTRSASPRGPARPVARPSTRHRRGQDDAHARSST